MSDCPTPRCVVEPTFEGVSLCLDPDIGVDGVTLMDQGVIQVDQDLALPLKGIPIQAGFPSPSDDYVEQSLDINQFMIAHPSATYFVRVVGDSMIEAHIQENDYLVVDRALTPTHNAIVIAVVDRELTVKRLYRQGGVLELRAENPNYPALRITGEMELQIWGVVCGVFRKT